MKTEIKKAIKNSDMLPDNLLIKLMFRYHIGRWPNLKNPKTFSEKLQWLKLFDRNPIYTILADKYEVRDYIKKMIGEKYLVPLLGVYDNFEEIDFRSLPEKFVLKPNHTSGDIYICKDKSRINYKQLRKKINSWLARNFYYDYREWPYKNIKPKIICEALLSEGSVETNSLTDYKIYCFNGVPTYCQVIQDRGVNSVGTIDFFDTEWNHMSFTGLQKAPHSSEKIVKPDRYEEMLEIAAKLSKEFPFVRVDFYYVNGNIYFGELTFFPRSGFGEFSPPEWNKKIGNLLKLPYK